MTDEKRAALIKHVEEEMERYASRAVTGLPGAREVAAQWATILMGLRQPVAPPTRARGGK